MVDNKAPRVGTMVVDNGILLENIQKLCPNHDIKHVVLCRGMDRYVGPNCSIPKGSAPLRRFIGLQRKTNELYVDEEWESWEHLSYRGLRRKCVSSRVGLTVFANTKIPHRETPELPSADVPIQIRERSGDTEESKSKRARLENPAAIHEPLDFGTVVSMDGITWSNSQGEKFHFYHFVDHATVFQTAVIAPSRNTEQAVKALLSGWMLWAGAPRTLVVDAATELNSEEFLNALQKHGTQCRTCAADAHWQNARAERHGGILQVILSKMDTEEPITDYDKLAMALQHATQTKNQWSRHRGYAPELLVFGKSVHIPGSVVSDPNRATHAVAL